MSGPDWTAVAEMPLPQTSLGIMAGSRSFFLGRPPLFLPNWLLTGAGAPHLVDRSAMQSLLARGDRVQRLDRAEPPLTLNTTDLQSGEEVLFDTRRDRLDARHFLPGLGIVDVPS